MHIDLIFYTIFVPKIWFQVSGFRCRCSALPLAWKVASLIEKQTPALWSQIRGYTIVSTFTDTPGPDLI